MQAGRHRETDTGQADQPGRRAQVGGLIPGRRHQGLLLPLDHQRAQRGGDPGGRIGVQLFVPAGAGCVEGGRGAVGRAVAGRGQHRFRRRSGVRGVQYGTQRGREPGSQSRIGPAVRWRVESQQGTAEQLLGVVGAGQSEPGGGEIDGPGAEPVTDRTAANRQRQRLEVAGRSGAEAPMVVDRQLDGRHALGECPGGSFGVARVVAQAGPASGLEGGHHAGQVRGLLVQQPAADQPGQVAGRVTGQGRGHGARVGGTVEGDLGVRPGPRVGQVGQLVLGFGGGADGQHRQGAASGGAEPHPGLLAHHDQAQPGPQLPTGRRRRGEQPRQTRIVELDQRQIVRLEAAGVRRRIGPDHLLRRHPGHRAGPQQLHRHRRTRSAIHRDTHSGADMTGRVPGAQIGRQGERPTPAHPGQEGQGRLAHGTAPATSPQAASRGASGRATRV